MENQPAPTRASKRIKLVRAAQEKLRPKSNEALLALEKSTFVHSIVSALPSRDEKFFPVGEGSTRRGPVAKEVSKKKGERGGENGQEEGEQEPSFYNSFDRKNLVPFNSTARRRRSPPEGLRGDQRRGIGAFQVPR